MDSKSIGTCNTTASSRKDSTQMTCLIHARKDNFVYIASDSWNTNPIHNHMIQKIAVNKENPLIIASAGENSSIYKNRTKKTILSFMKEFCNMYDGNNINEVISWLGEKTFDFINDMNLGDYSEKCTQYFIVYYDNKINEVVSLALETVKNHFNKTLNQETTTQRNMNYTSYGTYSVIINNQHICQNNNNFSSKELINNVVQEVLQYISIDKNITIDNRTVSGPIQWASIDKKGILKTNIDAIERDFYK